jgi:Kef-type K+ transport system membrane component KefB
VKGGTSVLIAGFGAGLMVAVIGGPKRLSTQVRGVAEGFFIPLYFVVLGARLDLAGLVRDPAMLALVASALVSLAVCTLGIEMLVRAAPAVAPAPEDVGAQPAA